MTTNNRPLASEVERRAAVVTRLLADRIDDANLLEQVRLLADWAYDQGYADAIEAAGRAKVQDKIGHNEAVKRYACRQARRHVEMEDAVGRRVSRAATVDAILQPSRNIGSTSGGPDTLGRRHRPTLLWRTSHASPFLSTNISPKRRLPGWIEQSTGGCVTCPTPTSCSIQRRVEGDSLTPIRAVMRTNQVSERIQLACHDRCPILQGSALL